MFNKKVVAIMVLVLYSVTFFVTNAHALAATKGTLNVSNQTGFEGMTLAVQATDLDGGANYAIFVNGLLTQNWTTGANEVQRQFYYTIPETAVFVLTTGITMAVTVNITAATVLDTYTVNGVGFGVFIPQGALINLAVTFLVLFLIVSILIGFTAGAVVMVSKRGKGGD